jgi:acyl carrier protein
MSDITTKLNAILRQHLKFLGDEQEIPADEELSKLGLDSMSAINLLLDVEQAFGIVIPDEMLTAETFHTQATLGAAISTLVGG